MNEGTEKVHKKTENEEINDKKYYKIIKLWFFSCGRDVFVLLCINVLLSEWHYYVKILSFDKY